MSDLDVLRSFAEARCDPDEFIPANAITYGQVRAVVSENERLRELLGGDARHYVDCYHLQFPDAGAGFVVQEIDALLEGKDGE